MTEAWSDRVEKYVQNEMSVDFSVFPSVYINSRTQDGLDIPQIRDDEPRVCIICKLMDSFATNMQHEFDDDSLPPKVLCWSDISPIDSKTASRTVRASMEKQYKRLHNKFDIIFQPVSYGTMIDILADYEDFEKNDLVIYHIYDPTITQSQKIIQPSTVLPKMKISTSSPHLNKMPRRKSVSHLNYEADAIPIHMDEDALRNLCLQLNEFTVFIIDCSFASKCASIINSCNKDFIVFAGSSESLFYTPQIPCDLFTSCLLTPGRVALLWQSSNYSDIRSGVLTDIDIQQLISILNDTHETPSIIKMIETCLCSCVEQMIYLDLQHSDKKFYEAFRSYPLINKLFSHFIFATRILKSYSMNPVSYPSIPNFANHPLWDSFDVHVDESLYSLREAMKPNPRKMIVLNDILEDQLNKLQSWMLFPYPNRPVPYEIQFIPPLLAVGGDFFIRTLHFCARFLRISRTTVIAFLYTQSFSSLMNTIKNTDFISSFGDEVLCDISYVILNCVLISPSLISHAKNHLHYWIDGVKSKHNELRVVSLCFLLLFSNNSDIIEKYKQKGIESVLIKLSKGDSIRQRSLAHLILAKFDREFDFTDLLTSVPLVRACCLSRVPATVKKHKPKSKIVIDLFITIVNNLVDMDQFVREESLVALSFIISYNRDFVSALDKFINNNANYPIINKLINKLLILLFDPSITVGERLIEFMDFVDSCVKGIEKDYLTSRADKACLFKVAKAQTNTVETAAFSEKSLVSQEIDLTGTPSISPSGYIACSDTSGSIQIQVSKKSKGRTIICPFVSLTNTNKIPTLFNQIASIRSKYKEKIAYTYFIDDCNLIAVSTSSQMVVCDIQMHDSYTVASVISSPTSSIPFIVDYNNLSHSLLFCQENNLKVFPIETLQSSINFNSTEPIERANWIQPYSNLIAYSKTNIHIFDTRTNETAATLKESGIDLLASNVSGGDPYYIYNGYSNGKISLVDFRTMSEVSHVQLSEQITQFNVHRHLPYAAGLGTNLHTINSENSELRVKVKSYQQKPCSFVLHPNEDAAAIRFRNTVNTMMVDY